MTVLECALGHFPYQSTDTNISLGFWDLMDMIVEGEVPTIPAETSTSELRDFTACCLARDPALRPTAWQLLQHPFLQPKSGKYSMSVASYQFDLFHFTLA